MTTLTGDSLIQKWLSREGQHRHAEVCPACGQALSATGLTKLAYTFEVCDCGTPTFEHLVEQLWHREHVRPVSS